MRSIRQTRPCPHGRSRIDVGVTLAVFNARLMHSSADSPTSKYQGCPVFHPELIAYAKSNPGKVAFGSSGHGTQPHLLGEMLKVMAGVDIVHVPYRGAGRSVTDVVAGQVQMIFEARPPGLSSLSSTARLSATAMLNSSAAG